MPPKRSRTAVRNIVHIPRGKGPYANISSEQDAFNKLIDKNMIDIIVKHTNEEISRRCSNYSDQRFVGDTDAVEILAPIGLLYASGSRKDSHLTTCDMFSSFGPSIYKCIMSEMRFKFLLLCLRFDDKVNRDPEDKFAAFRDLWALFISHCRESYVPHAYVTR